MRFDGGFMINVSQMKRFFTARNIAFLGVLVALVVVLQLWGSMIPIGAAGLNLSFVLIPVTLGAILLGPVAGLILGFVFGFIVLMTGVAGTNFFTAYVLTDSPFITTLTCLIKGMAAGGVAGVVYNLIKKKNKYVAVFVAAAVVPILNTGIFILGALCMSGTVKTFVTDYMPAFDGRNIMYIIIVGLVTVNFFIEFAINLICAPALYAVDNVVEKQILKNVKKKKNVSAPEQENTENKIEEV